MGQNRQLPAGFDHMFPGLRDFLLIGQEFPPSFGYRRFDKEIVAPSLNENIPALTEDEIGDFLRVFAIAEDSQYGDQVFDSQLGFEDGTVEEINLVFQENLIPR